MLDFAVLRSSRRCSTVAREMTTVATAAAIAVGTIAAATVAVAAVAEWSPLAAQGSPAAPRLMRAGDVDTIPLHRPATRIAYGTDSLQFGELRLPNGAGPFPVAIVVHGGCWLSRYANVRNTSALAEALAEAGIATWNVEYRRYDHPGGGWTGTFRDVADGADFVRTLARTYPLDTTRLVATGHSAGGHLALWLASRTSLGASSPLRSGTPMRLTGVVSIGGIADLREFYLRESKTCGNPAVESLLGGVPDSVPQRLRDASPIERLPLGVPSAHIAGARDMIAPEAVRDAYVMAARQRGDSAWQVTVSGDGHFEAITPTTPSGRAVIEAIRRFLMGPP